MIQEAHESVQHCLHMTKSSPIDLLWSLSWMHVWSWGLNLWPVALALGWPFAWGRMLWTGVCRCWRMHIGSFWAFCNGRSAWCPLISVELPQSLSINCFTNPDMARSWEVALSDSQLHLKRDEILVLLPGATEGNSGISRTVPGLANKEGERRLGPRSLWDEGINHLTKLFPVSKWVCVPTWSCQLIFSLDNSFWLLPFFLFCLAQQIPAPACPENLRGMRFERAVVCTDGASAEGLLLLFPMLNLTVGGKLNNPPLPGIAM